VEHRHDGQGRVHGGEIHHVGQRCGEGMQHHRSMRVQRTLGVTGRTRRVAKAGGGGFIQHWPSVIIVFRLKQSLVAEQVGYQRRRHVPIVGHGDPAFYARAKRQKHFHQRREIDVEEHQLVVGMVDHPCDLLRKQPRVDRVHHGTATRNRVAQLHMPIAVPGQRADPIALIDAEASDRRSQLPRPACQFAPAVAMKAVVALCAFNASRHDLGVAMTRFRVSEQAADQQRLFHHLAFHCLTSRRHAGKARKPPVALRCTIQIGRKGLVEPLGLSPQCAGLRRAALSNPRHFGLGCLR